MQEALGFDSPSPSFFDFRFCSFCFILVFGLVYPLVSIVDVHLYCIWNRHPPPILKSRSWASPFLQTFWLPDLNTVYVLAVTDPFSILISWHLDRRLF